MRLAGEFASDPRRYVFGSFEVLSGAQKGLTREIASAERRLDGTLRLDLDEPLPDASPKAATSALPPVAIASPMG